MDKEYFIESFKSAFGNIELPLAIWYSDEPAGKLEKSRGCFMKDLKPARSGETVSFNLETISCPGGKVYSGFMEMPSFLPGFVSQKECYKETPEQVVDFVEGLEVADQTGKYLNFVTIDRIENFEGLEGLLFFGTPDILTGLVSWAHYDNCSPDAVSLPFGSGCSTVVAHTTRENRNNGQRTFLGMFDPSVRPHIESNLLSFTIPMSRFRKMYHTFNESCLKGTHAWHKVKERIELDGN